MYVYLSANWVAAPFHPRAYNHLPCQNELYCACLCVCVFTIAYQKKTYPQSEQIDIETVFWGNLQAYAIP